MPNYTGLWTANQQLQARGSSLWPTPPGSPTSVVATAGTSSASVAFTAPSDVGYPGSITSYTVTSSPGSFTGTGATSPITVSGLTNGTSYTFTVTATNSTGTSPASAASSAVTPVAPPVYVDDVFSTALYVGNDSSQTITNGIDLTTNGGMVWVKGRDIATEGTIIDTARGINKNLNTTSSGSQHTDPSISAFSSTGFTINSIYSFINDTGYNYVSWTFRKAPKFFDVVTYTGNGGYLQVPHNLGATPGCVIIKRTDSTSDWGVWHRAGAAGGGSDGALLLNSTAAKQSGGVAFSVSSSNFAVFNSDFTMLNSVNGASYVAYLFAHNAGGFGETGNDNIISCGAFASPSDSGLVTVNLGYEPQFVLWKQTNGTADWMICDATRGAPAPDNYGGRGLRPNSSAVEDDNGRIAITPTGFKIAAFSVSSDHIYIAIRRPHKAPTLGSQVYQTITRTGSGSSTAVLTTGITTDLLIQQARAGDGYGNRITSRPQGNKNMISYRTEGESGVYSSNSNPLGWDVQLGVRIGNQNNGWDQGGATFVNHAFKRAAKFMDVVTWVGDSQTTNADGKKVQPHNLGAAPEFIIMKGRNNEWDWWSYHNGCTRSTSGTRYQYVTKLNTSDAEIQLFGDGSGPVLPDASNFYLASGTQLNQAGYNYVAYCFATLAGVSKVGNYTGNGSSQTIDCGFTTGARFILIKRTDSTGDWYLWDSVRGIVTGNDPHTSPNTLGAEVTTNDSIDPANSGFIVNQVSATNVNVTSAKYIFLAIA